MEATDPVAGRRSARTPDRAGAVADSLFAMLCAVLLAFIVDRLAREGRVWALDLATGVAVCGVALARRRRPLAAPIVALAVSGVGAVVAMAAGLPSEPGPAAILGLMVLAGTAVRRLAAVPATVIAVCGEVVAGSGRLGALAGYQTSHAAYWFATQGWLVAVAVGVWLRYLDRRRRGMAEAVRRDERLAMARELHDVVAHHITGIVVQTQAARITARRRDRADPDGLDATLAEIEAASGEALTAMRRVVGLLRDADDAATTGAGAGPGELAELVRRFDGHGPVVTLTLPAHEELRWPPEIASTVYRVVQESLTNIARHAAHARSASVRIARDPRGGIRIEVTDDAPAGPPRHLHRGGFGLVGMRERVEALGGTLDAGPQPAPASGWAVTATVPAPTHGARS
ncbi:hypothetical protein KGQ20_27070 [Catenulispora sp. NF23]|uniref:sensor histidine kinase n=1 Tax=Catenulispora pinistramenti TaxID=2705254 RepID=UPI001BA78CBF|nr:histidine kinase [Catenulispora pinistramenti]MBS2536428.1 hypothetical protein [Catenulispora pinistramenti]